MRQIETELTNNAGAATVLRVQTNLTDDAIAATARNRHSSHYPGHSTITWDRT